MSSRGVSSYCKWPNGWRQISLAGPHGTPRTRHNPQIRKPRETPRKALRGGEGIIVNGRSQASERAEPGSVGVLPRGQFQRGALRRAFELGAGAVVARRTAASRAVGASGASSIAAPRTCGLVALKSVWRTAGTTQPAVAAARSTRRAAVFRRGSEASLRSALGAETIGAARSIRAAAKATTPVRAIGGTVRGPVRRAAGAATLAERAHQLGELFAAQLAAGVAVEFLKQPHHRRASRHAGRARRAIAAPEFVRLNARTRRARVAAAFPWRGFAKFRRAAPTTWSARTRRPTAAVPVTSSAVARTALAAAIAHDASQGLQKRASPSEFLADQRAIAVSVELADRIVTNFGLWSRRTGGRIARRRAFLGYRAGG